MAQVTSALQSFIIGFVIIAPQDTDAAIGGSGTLVSVGATRGILTAAHVIRELRKQEEIGIVLPVGTSARRMTFDMAYTAHVTLVGANESEGPDIGFLKLPPDTADSLNSIMSFYNLSRRAARMLDQPPVLRDGIWGLSGYPQELTTDKDPNPDASMRVKVFRGGIGFGIVVDEEERGEFDYLRYEALYNEFYEGPDRFGGISGGGLWQILINLTHERPTIREHLLSGVAFYQTSKFSSPQGIKRHIVCHGRKSVYGVLLEKVRTESWD